MTARGPIAGETRTRPVTRGRRIPGFAEDRHRKAVLHADLVEAEIDTYVDGELFECSVECLRELLARAEKRGVRP